MRLAVRCGSVLATAALIVGALPATPALAIERYCMGLIHEAPVYFIAEGCFEAVGDEINARDQRADGLRAVTEWETDYGREGECHNALGEGWNVICNYDMREANRVRLRTCTRNGASAPNTKCTFWSPWLSISTGNPA